MACYLVHMANDKATEVLERIEAARKDADRTVRWVSEKSGIAYPTLRRRLVAPGSLTLQEIDDLARVLGTTPELLLGTAVHA